MKTEKVTVFDLFEKQRRYLVPLYQRGYVWTRAGQWEPFWDNITEQAGSVRQQLLFGNQNTRKHFLGAIVVHPLPTGIKDVPASDVIDGQQRLVTLQILLRAFYDILSADAYDYAKSTLRRLTSNPRPHREPEEEYKVWPTYVSQDDWRQLMTAGSVQALAEVYPLSQPRKKKKGRGERPLLIEAYCYFADRIEQYLHKDESEPDETTLPQVTGDQRVDELLEAITKRIQLVAIDLDEEDDAQVIFETLNARGIPLEPSDLIRNYIFLAASRRREDVRTLYEQWWKPFDATTGEETFWRVRERQGRLSRSRLDLLMYHYLTYRTEKVLKIGHLFQEFQDWWEGAPAGRLPAHELKELHRASDNFKRLIAPRGTERLDVLAHRLKALDTSTLYPLLLWLMENREDTSDREFDTILSLLESYLVRRAICGLTTKNYNRIFVQILVSLRANGRPSAQLLTNILASFEGDSVLWPDDSRFVRAIIEKPLYNDLRPLRTQMVLEALNAALHSKYQEPITIHGPLTIEHILPQAADPGKWPYSASNRVRTAEDAKAIRDTAMHSLGNLTLVTQPLNSAVSNGPFAGKRPVIAAQSLLRLNTYFQQFDDASAWDEDAIHKRGAILADVAVQIWPRPTPARV
jgi:uncharacterized protein with ParB-like and HNH nuclease domain